MYDVEVQGVADKPALKFYDRGTFSQAVELGPSRAGAQPLGARTPAAGRLAVRAANSLPTALTV